MADLDTMGKIPHTLKVQTCSLKICLLSFFLIRDCHDEDDS